MNPLLVAAIAIIVWTLVLCAGAWFVGWLDRCYESKPVLFDYETYDRSS